MVRPMICVLTRALGVASVSAPCATGRHFDLLGRPRRAARRDAFGRLRRTHCRQLLGAATNRTRVAGRCASTCVFFDATWTGPWQPGT